MSDLKPCPFCGATPLLYDLLETHGVFSVECPTFGCDADSTKHTKDEAIKAWNRRAQSSNQSTVEVGTTVQAGQVLSDSALLAMWTGEVLSYAHAIVQAVLAKRVPMKTQRVTYTCPACHFSLEREE